MLQVKHTTFNELLPIKVVQDSDQEMFTELKCIWKLDR